MRGLKGKVAIVTGGGSGIGRAISRRLAEEGAIVGVFDVNEAGAKETIGHFAGPGYAIRTDITDLQSVEKSVGELQAKTGPIDILINNAGWDKMVPFLQSDPPLWKKIIDINLYGPVHMHYAVLPGMVERRSGKVVNISSDAGRVGSSGEAVYSACKGGIIAFTKTLARELARYNIQLNTVCPGPTDTPLFAAVAADSETGAKIAEALKTAIPMRRLGRPEDYPGLVAFLASEDANFITGQTISVSGGLSMHG
jgi:2-hydroxycyclohexanecarboxyl-CoA dehydrogenase